MFLKFAIDIYNIWIFLFIKLLIRLILHIYVYIYISITPKKMGLNYGFIICLISGTLNINYGKKKYEENRLICLSPLIL